MDILLLVIVLVIAACEVYVAASFDRRVSGKIGPLFETAQELLSRGQGAVGARTDERIGRFAVLLAVNLENTRQELDERMSQLDVRISQAVSPLAAELDGIETSSGKFARPRRPATNCSKRPAVRYARSEARPGKSPGRPARSTASSTLAPNDRPGTSTPSSRCCGR